MNKYRGLMAFALAIGFGLLAVVLANKWLTSRDTRAIVTVKDTIPLAQVVVASRDIGVGVSLTNEVLTLAEWPKANLPRGVFHDLSRLRDRVAITRLAAGLPILDSALAPPGAGAGLVAKIAPGMRAISVRVDEVTGVGGFILPDALVDVHCIETRKSSGGEKISKIILKNIRVLAIAQEAAKEDEDAKIVHTVTLELDPDRAETLALQVNRGPIHLALRPPPRDDEKAPTPVVVKPTVPRIVRTIPRPAKPAYAAPRPGPYTVEVLRGSEPPEIVQFRHINSDERL